MFPVKADAGKNFAGPRTTDRTNSIGLITMSTPLNLPTRKNRSKTNRVNKILKSDMRENQLINNIIRKAKLDWDCDCSGHRKKVKHAMSLRL